jgi:NodT family efflux transporter outer membrane factor (OMF) lipoprotein
MRRTQWIAISLLVALSACASAPPRSTKSLASIPSEWSDGPWREAHPADASNRGNWWLIFNDSVLNDLETKAIAQNLNLQVAAARVKQARSLAANADSAFIPLVTANPTATRSRNSANRPALTPNVTPVSTTLNDFVPSASVRWETDLSGRLSSTLQAAQAATGQSEADQESLKLLVTANLASNYFSLRTLDADIAWQTRMLQLEKEVIGLLRRRILLGQASAYDLNPAQAALEVTQVQIATLRGQRDPLLTAIAVLINANPQNFDLPAGILPEQIPSPYAGIPSDLLERRPDIAGAERAVAQASAQIGIANSARYPSLTLGATLGAESSVLNTLVNAPSLIWSLGFNLSQILFDGGRTESSVAAAKAAHEASVANYRATVLSAVAEVETTLRATRTLNETLQQQDGLVKTEREQTDLLRKKQSDGMGTRYDTVIAEQSLIQAERTRTQLKGQQILAAVYLVKALGGGWDSAQITRKE